MADQLREAGPKFRALRRDLRQQLRPHRFVLPVRHVRHKRDRRVSIFDILHRHRGELGRPDSQAGRNISGVPKRCRCVKTH